MSSGSFAALALPQGTYNVTATVTGYLTHTQSDIRVTANAEISTVFTMTPESSGNTFPLDIDSNSNADALTDGLLIHRYLLGLSGTALTDGAVADNCTRCTAAGADGIESYIGDAVTSGDIDIDQDADRNVNDGVLILRYLFGFRGNALINGICTGCSAATIETRMDSLVP